MLVNPDRWVLQRSVFIELRGPSLQSNRGIKRNVDSEAQYPLK